MPLPDPTDSRAVLIGASRYDTLEPLPAVANNLARLTQLLTDPDLWGLPSDHVAALLNPASRDEVLEAVHDAALAATNAILIYFAGHGLLERTSSALHLALPGASVKSLHRALRYDELRREITKTCGARHKVVVLDCCFSGQAMDGFMAGSPEMADQARIEGTYLMTASAETALALAEPGEPFTAFTGELVHAMEHGVPDGPALLDMGTLYFQVRASLLAKGRPEPQERARNDGRSIALLRNRRGAGALVDSHQPETYHAPEPPAGYEHLLRRPPRDTLEAIGQLRADDHPAAAQRLLEAVAGRLPGQQLAATMQLLFRAGRGGHVEDGGTALREVTRRPPDEIMALLDALRELGETAIIQALLDLLAQGPVDQTVAVASLLDAATQREEAVALLDATAAARPDTQATLGLIAALWTAGKADEIERLLATTAARTSPHQVLELADALRTAGREESAFGLYLHAVDILVRRPPDELASIVHTMCSAGRSDDAWALCEAALNACADAASNWCLAEALWGVGQDDFAVRAIEAGALLLSEEQVTALLEALCVSEHGDAVLGYCMTALTQRSRPMVVPLVDALRDHGRPVDANRLLSSLLTMEPEQAVPLIRSLADVSDDTRRIFDGVIAAPADYQARFIATWLYGAQSSARIGPAIHQALGQRPEAAARMVEIIAQRPSEEQLSAQLFRDVFADPAQAALGFQFLGASGDKERVEALLAEWLQQVTDMSSAIDMAVAFRELDAAARALNRHLPASLVSADAGDPRTILAVVAPLFQGARIWGLPVDQVGALLPAEIAVRLLTELHKREGAAAERLVRTIAHHRAADGVPAVVKELDSAGLESDTSLLLRLITLQRPQNEVRHIGRLLRKQGMRTWATRLG